MAIVSGRFGGGRRGGSRRLTPGQWLDHKSRLMEASLGPMHEIVSHAIVPYEKGGSLHLYYYVDGLPGTAIATKQLSPLPERGSRNRVFGCYELVMFTRHPLDLHALRDPKSAFGRAHRFMNRTLNLVAGLSVDATVNPGDTSEFPADFDVVGGRCLVFDGYARHSDEVVGSFGLMVPIEVFRSELDFALRHCGTLLLERLKAAGHYPYSDLDRDPVA